MASVFKRKGKGNYLANYTDENGKRRERSTRTTDKRAALRMAHQWENEAALVRAGVVDASQDRFAREGRKPIREHVEAYVAHSRAKGEAKRHIHQKKQHLEAFLDESGASRLADLTVDLLVANLTLLRERELSACTLNHRRKYVVGFANWCVRTGRLAQHGLGFVPKLDEEQDRRRERRALTDDELRRLLAVATQRRRKAWYLAAALAGLRRGELTRLTWGDVDLEQGYLVVRGGKAKREDLLPLHPDLATELKRVRPQDAAPQDRVFPRAVMNRTRQRDFDAAGIQSPDERGRVVDLHALRTTLGTQLARQGVSPQVCQAIMRHADYRTTLRHYTRLRIEDARQGIARIPSPDGEP